MNNTYNELFSSLSAVIENFIQEVKNKKSDSMTGDEWSVKDQLCHIVFWHENYAANYEALAAHRVPPIPEGMSTINMAGVLSLRKTPVRTLIMRLRKANKSLYVSTVVDNVPRMTYSKGGRVYETADFLAMITRHIANHTQQVKRAK
ncbi:hypothetical protein KJZ67_03845 [Patescibacteria group bacterium]|nr:hypothetical protein [Patescibacteria group bacterium]